MSQNHPNKAQVVIIGGGVIGCSIAYQLAKNGVTDVVVLERKSISSGTSWHAAGILSEMRSSESMIKMAKETTNMFKELQEETGHHLKFKRTGSVFVTSVQERYYQFKAGLSLCKSMGVEAHEISIKEAKDKWPLIHTDDLLGSIYVPNDALICPEEGTRALAKGAEMHGAKVFENTKVVKLTHENGKVTGVETDDGVIKADFVVATTGIWSRDFLFDYNVNVPLHAMEHYYLLTSKIEGLNEMMPLLRDFDARTYVRPTIGTRWHEEVGHLMVGFFEHGGKPWGMDGIPEDFEYGRLEEDWGHIDKVFDKVRHRLPILKDCKIETFLNGPESFTYDNNYLIGESQTMDNLMICTGFNSRGIQSCGGAGRLISEWIINKRAPNRYDTHDIDSLRPPEHSANRKYLYDRSIEVLGLLYDINYPYLQLESCRPLRTSPLHDRLDKLGAVMGEMGGWERPNWYAPEGVKKEYQYSYLEQNWFKHSFNEHMAVRENVAVFDQTSFGKILIQGRDTLKFLDRLCGSKMDVPIGKVVYTQILNEIGGIESDITFTRTGEQEFLLYTTAVCQKRDFYYMKRWIKKWQYEVCLADITSGSTVLGIMGPRSRELMAKMSNADFSHESFKFATSKIIDFGYARARATRLTFVGELGWEVTIPSEFAATTFDLLMKEGESLNLKPAGYHAMNALRLEKSYVHWGHDVSGSETPIEANLGFTLRFKKESDFLGREKLKNQKENGVSKRLVTFKMSDPKTLLYHYEPIFRNGEMVGHMTSGQYSPYFNCAIGLGYIHNQDGIVDDNYIMDASYEINVLNENKAATPSLGALYDPNNERIKA